MLLNYRLLLLLIIITAFTFTASWALIHDITCKFEQKILLLLGGATASLDIRKRASYRLHWFSLIWKHFCRSFTPNCVVKKEGHNFLPKSLFFVPFPSPQLLKTKTDTKNSSAPTQTELSFHSTFSTPSPITFSSLLLLSLLNLFLFSTPEKETFITILYLSLSFSD